MCNLKLLSCRQIWPPGSLGEEVQNLVMTWEMEMLHKVNPKDYKSINLDK